MFEIGLVFVLIIAFILVGIPVAFSMFMGGILGLGMLGGQKAVSSFISYSLHDLIANYSLAVAPLFIFVGEAALATGLAEKCYQAFNKWFGRMKGGLLIVTVVASALFGACSGSTVASAAIFSKLAIPEMRKYNYKDEISMGGIAAAGGLAAIIPPSIMVVLYGTITGTPIGKALIAGVIPGILLAVLFILMILLYATVRPKDLPKTAAEAVPVMEKLRATASIWPIIAIFLVIIGGIWAGFFTPTEAGAVASAVMIIFAVLGRLGFGKLLQVFYSTAGMTAQIGIIVISGMMVSKAVVLSGVTDEIIKSIESAGFSAFWLWVIVILIYLVLGCLIDPVSMLVITLPFLFPIMTGIGVDPLQFSVIILLMVNVAIITPPFGINCYVIASTMGVDPVVVFRGITPWLLVISFMTVLLILVPGLSTWLPNLLYR